MQQVLLVRNNISLGFDGSLFCLGTGYRVISPLHLSSVSKGDWVALTSQGDFPVILIVISLICLILSHFLGDSIEPTVIYFCHFLSLMQFVEIRLANISTALNELSCHFPQWNIPSLNQALFTKRSNVAGCQAVGGVVLMEFGYLTTSHKGYLITCTCPVSVFTQLQ